MPTPADIPNVRAVMGRAITDIETELVMAVHLLAYEIRRAGQGSVLHHPGHRGYEAHEDVRAVNDLLSEWLAANANSPRL